jgi:hypothetical protein
MTTDLHFDFTVNGAKLPDYRRLQVESFLQAAEGKNVTVSYRRGKMRPSRGQQGYWWAVIVPAVHGYMIHQDPTLTRDDVHDMMLYRLLPEKRRSIKWGDDTEVWRASFTSLTTAECADLFERAWAWAATKLGLAIDSPGEYAGRQP